MVADGPFKTHLDRYKYPTRYDDVDYLKHREAGFEILQKWDERIAKSGQFLGTSRTLADIAVFPFVRQFANHDREWFDAQPLPALQKWLTGHLQSELFQKVMAKYQQWHTGQEEPLFAAA